MFTLGFGDIMILAVFSLASCSRLGWVSLPKWKLKVSCSPTGLASRATHAWQSVVALLLNEMCINHVKGFMVAPTPRVSTMTYHATQDVAYSTILLPTLHGRYNAEQQVQQS